MRVIIGTVIGILLAFGLIYLAQQVGGALSPVVYDPATEEVQIPLANTVALFVGWFVGTFAGAWFAMRMTAINGAGWVVAGAVAGAAIYRAISLGDAVWVTAAGFVIPLAATWLAARVVRLTA
jgi:uncharacterized membrane protein